LLSIFNSPPGAEPLYKALGECRVYFFGAAVFSAFVNLLYLAPTLYMMQVYDRVIPTSGLTTLALVTLVAVFALGTLASLDWLRGRLMVRVGLRLEDRLAHSVLARVMDMGGRRHVSQAMREFDTLKAAASGPAIIALFDAPWTPLYLLCCYLLHPAIGVLTLAGGALLFILALLNERESRPRLRQAMTLSNQAYASQEAMLGQTEVVRALGMAEASIRRQLRQRQEAAQQHVQAQLTGGRYSGAIRFVRLLLQSLSLGLAAFLAVKGQLSAGSIIAASVLLSRAVAPIETLVGAWPSLVQARASWIAITEIFVSTSAFSRPKTQLPPPKGRLQLEGVVARIAPGDQPQLKGVNLRLEPGQTLGVIGPSGSGKTTLARIMAGALAPTAGVVRIDGADYQAWSADELARHIGYLPQNPSLMAGSIKDNISRFDLELGRDAVDVDRNVVAAAQTAGAHEMILRLPQGYDTRLGELGAGLSAGQAQRIALARALYGDPALLVLDEPNSNLDQDGEIALMNAVLQGAGRGSSVVIVAHRAGILSRVDRLLTLKDGAVQIEGPREDVLSRMRAAAPAATGKAAP